MIIKPKIYTSIPFRKITPIFSPAPLPKTLDRTSFSSDIDFNKKVLLSRKIIDENQTMDSFFDGISSEIFDKDDKQKTKFSSALKAGEITLSTSVYSNLKHPYSAIGIVLDEKKSDAAHLAKLDEHIRNGAGIGLNFSRFKNPTNKILKINSYLKYCEKTAKRPPAAIGLLDIHHPDIVDFITLKDDADYSKWCFDLSVIIDDDFMKKVENNDTKTKQIYQTLLKSMKKSGEPAVIFSNDKNYIADCCAAAPLKPNETLTLGHINLSKFCNNKQIDYKKLEKSAETLAVAMKKIDKDSFIGILGYQDLLDKMGIQYGSNEALSVLENSLKIIQNTSHKHNLKTAISPTGNTSRLLKTTPSIEPGDSNCKKEIETMARAQKYLDGNISKTILLDQNATIKDVDEIIKSAYKKGLRGISVFSANKNKNAS